MGRTAELIKQLQRIELVPLHGDACQPQGVRMVTQERAKRVGPWVAGIHCWSVMSE